MARITAFCCAGLIGPESFMWAISGIHDNRCLAESTTKAAETATQKSFIHASPLIGL